MVTLLIDANLDGHGDLLDMRLRTATWRELRDYLDVRFLHFEGAALDRNAKDDAVWQFCQDHGYLLLTANRNQESDDSLEATIRREGKDDSLPVLTFADADGLYQSATYLDKVCEKLLDYLLNLENYRGAGRLFLP